MTQGHSGNLKQGRTVRVEVRRDAFFPDLLKVMTDEELRHAQACFQSELTRRRQAASGDFRVGDRIQFRSRKRRGALVRCVVVTVGQNLVGDEILEDGTRTGLRFRVSPDLAKKIK